MNAEELRQEFNTEFPAEIDGYKRPDEKLESGHDWFLEIPQIIVKDKVLYTGMNLILSTLLSNENLLKQWHDTLQSVVNAQDWRVVTDSLKGYMTPELKKKLDGIATGANNYVHPSSHPATMITQDATHRFVSDTEKNTWNAKASTAVVTTTANGLAPKRDGNANHFLAGDGTWKTVETANNATKAVQDSQGRQINTTYLAGSTNIQNNLNNCTTEGIYRFSGTLTNGWTSESWGTLLVFNNKRDGASGASGTYIVQLAFPTDGRIWQRQRVNTGAWTGWTKVAITTDNVASATKATQDSAGQQINTTYVKGVTGSNATLTITKGNGSTSSVTINNVTNANVVTEKAITGNTLASAIPTGLTWSKVYNNNFPCAHGNCITIKGAGAIQIVTEWSGSDATPANMYFRNARDSTIDKWSAWRTVAHTGSTVSVANKLGTATVGGTAKPIYLNGGTPTSLSATAGGTAKPVYLSAGTITACSATVGSGVKPIYSNAGTLTASGSNVGSATKPVYMNAGTITACNTDMANLAPKASPAFSGTPTSPTPATSDNSTKIATTAFVRNLINQFKNDGTLGGIVGGSLTQNGWVKFSNGLILQWGFDTTSDYDISPSQSKTINFPITFQNNCFIVLPVMCGSWAACVCWVSAKTKTNYTIKFEEWASDKQSVHVGYLAIGN